MTIRARLLLILLPGLIAIIAAGSWFLHYRWTNEIIATHRSRLATVATACAQMIDPNDHHWIDQHRDNPQIIKSKRYQYYHGMLTRVRGSLPLSRLYTARLKPVQKGDPVLLSLPISDRNPAFDGHTPGLAYRKVYVIDGGMHDPSAGPFHKVRAPGDDDFCQNGEHSIYYTKQVMVSPIYTSMRTGGEMMTAYAPILDRCGHVAALVGAEVSLDAIRPALQKTTGIVVACSLGAVFLAIVGVYLFAQKISAPLRTLGDSALAIAGGEYGAAVKVKGPSELVELANTLNTMSGCLEEHFTDLKEDSLLRERQHGERESCLMLQYNLLRGPAKQWHSKHLKVKSFSYNDHTLPIGCRLTLASEGDTDFNVALTDANASGFDPMYDLVQLGNDKLSPPVTVKIDGDTATVEVHPGIHGYASLWSAHEELTLSGTASVPFPSGTILILGNLALRQVLIDNTDIADWLHRLFETFTVEGPEVTVQAATQELKQLLQDGRDLPEGGIHTLFAWVAPENPSSAESSSNPSRRGASKDGNAGNTDAESTLPPGYRHD